MRCLSAAVFLEHRRYLVIGLAAQGPMTDERVLEHGDRHGGYSAVDREASIISSALARPSSSMCMMAVLN